METGSKQPPRKGIFAFAIRALKRVLALGRRSPGQGGEPGLEAPQSTGKHGPSSGVPVLVVDDDARMRRLIHTALIERGGYDVTMAASGEEALEIARQIRPHVVVIDVMMGEMNGLRLCSELKGDPSTKRARVIVISGLHEAHVRSWARMTGADAFLDKPFSTEALLHEIQFLASSHSDVVLE